MRTTSLTLLAALLLSLAVLFTVSTTTRAADPTLAPLPAPAPAKQPPAAEPLAPADLPQAAQCAVSANPAEAAIAIAQLRASGPAGLAAVQTAFAPIIARHTPANEAYQSQVCGVALPGFEAAQWERIKNALDHVGGQYDEHVSGLYWYTDFTQAQAAASAQHKPILSLRMLGKLTDEYSCANSRFFRTALYSNPAIQKKMRDEFILHWESVRPVPVVTIDMGDGRVIKRTITGNSIHYVLDEHGRIIDAIPGLYGPGAFMTMLTQGRAAALTAGPLPSGQALDRYLQNFHAQCEKVVLARFAMETRQVNPSATSALATTTADADVTDVTNADVRGEDEIANDPMVLEEAPGPVHPPAVAAIPRAIGKGLVEAPVLTAMETRAALLTTATTRTLTLVSPAAPKAAAAQGFTVTYVPAKVAMGNTMSKAYIERPLTMILPPSADAITAVTADPAARAIAALATLHAAEAKLDPATIAYMRSFDPCDACVLSTPAAPAPAAADDRFAATVAHFEESLAQDTVRDEYQVHLQIHEWLRQNAALGLATAAMVANAQVRAMPAVSDWAATLNAFNERVYAELFLTPSSDPWLGLVPPDTFSALHHDGLVR